MNKIRPGTWKVWKQFMYRLLPRLTLFLSVFVIALPLPAQDRQVIKGVIMDEANMRPIPYAHLQFKDSTCSKKCTLKYVPTVEATASLHYPQDVLISG